MSEMKYFDTHAHYVRGFPAKGRKKYTANMIPILEHARKSGVEKIMNVATNRLFSIYLVEDFKEYPWHMDADKMPEIILAIGEHPKWIQSELFEAQDRTADEEFRELCKNPRVRAIKTGLDHTVEIYKYNRQEKRFRDLIRLSKEVDLPLILHIREAYEDAIRILKEEAKGEKYKGVIHCFSSDYEDAMKLIELGFFIGIGGKVTYPDNLEIRDAAARIPLEHLVLETDCPYIPIYKGPKMNTSSDLAQIAACVLDLRGEEEESLEMIYENSIRLFE